MVDENKAPAPDAMVGRPDPLNNPTAQNTLDTQHSAERAAREKAEAEKNTTSNQVKQPSSSTFAASKDAATKAEKAKADADKAQADKVAADQKLYNETVEADQKAREEELARQPINVVGSTMGGPFTIGGVGFGSSGTLTIGGREIPTTRWDDNQIRGVLPPGVKGDVVIKTGSGERHGTFPTPPPQTETVTTQTITRPVQSPKP